MNPVFVRKLVTLVALSFVFSGCSDPIGPRAPRGLEIRPTADVFPISTVGERRRVTMRALIENDSDRTVYYSYCSETVSKRTSGEWKAVFRPVCAAILVPPEAIRPGESKQITADFIEHPEIPAIGFPFDDPSARSRLEAVILFKKGDDFVALSGIESGTFAVRN